MVYVLIDNFRILQRTIFFEMTYFSEWPIFGMTQFQKWTIYWSYPILSDPFFEVSPFAKWFFKVSMNPLDDFLNFIRAPFAVQNFKKWSPKTLEEALLTDKDDTFLVLG